MSFQFRLRTCHGGAGLQAGQHQQAVKGGKREEDDCGQALQRRSSSCRQLLPCSQTDMLIITAMPAARHPTHRECDHKLLRLLQGWIARLRRVGCAAAHRSSMQWHTL